MWINFVKLRSPAGYGINLASLKNEWWAMTDDERKAFKGKSSALVEKACKDQRGPPPPFPMELLDERGAPPPFTAPEDIHDAIRDNVLPKLFNVERGIIHKFLTRETADIAWFLCATYQANPNCFVIRQEAGKSVVHMSKTDPRPHIQVQVKMDDVRYRTLHIGFNKLKVTYMTLYGKWCNDRYEVELIPDSTILG